MRRALLIPAIVTVVLVGTAPAALAGEARGEARGHAHAPGLTGHGSTDEVGPRGGKGPSDSGSNHARAGSAKGMNRPGSPGEWKEKGHVPAPHSFPQGRSPSDPDADGNGGLDKPGETGGFSDDRDGNNGCGNDDDREDDNNGWCGKPPHAHVGPPSEPPGGGGPPPGVEPPVIVPPSVPPPPSTSTPPTRVLDRVPTTRPAPTTPLATTGLDLQQMLLLGLGSMLAGVSVRRRR